MDSKNFKYEKVISLLHSSKLGLQNNNVKLITSVKNKKNINKYRNSFLFINSNFNNLRKKLKKYVN